MNLPALPYLLGGEDVHYYRALGFTQAAHGEQTRKYTREPYWFHPVRVAAMVSRTPLRSIEMIQAALLHDVFDDTPTSHSTLLGAFGITVYNYVLTLSDESAETRQERLAKTLARMRKSVPEVQTIKLADMLDNAGSIAQVDPVFALVYLPEKDEVLRVCHRGDPGLWAQCDEAIRRGMREVMLDRRL